MGAGVNSISGGNHSVAISRQGSSDSANMSHGLTLKQQHQQTAIIKIHFDTNNFTIGMDLSSTAEEVRDRVMKKGET